MNKEQKLTELQSKLNAIQAEMNQLNEKPKYPDSVDVIPRKWIISNVVNIDNLRDVNIKDIKLLSTKERAEAFLSLMQLREIHAEMVKYYEPDDFRKSFSINDKNEESFSIIFWFKTEEEVNHFKTNPKIQELVNTIKTGF